MQKEIKALILAGGFGERLDAGFQSYAGPYLNELREWVENKPKGLVTIKIKDKLQPILAYQLEQIYEAGIAAKNVYIQSNAHHYPQFKEWAQRLGIPEENVFNNGVEKKEERLGPLGDLTAALMKIGYDSPLLVMASDTLVLAEHGAVHPLAQFVQSFYGDGHPRMIVYEGEQARLRKHGLVEVNAQGLVCGFQQKPQEPEPLRSALINASIHLYTPEVLAHIPELHRRYGKDESIDIIQHLYAQFPIKVEHVAQRVDIGTIEDVLKMNVG